MKNTKRCPEHFLWHYKLPQNLVVYNNFLEFTICGSETRQVQLGDCSAPCCSDGSQVLAQLGLVTGTPAWPLWPGGLGMAGLSVHKRTF